MGRESDARRAREAAARRVRKKLGAPGVKRASEATIKKVTRSSGGGGGGSSRVTTVVTGAPASAPERLGETTVTETLASGQTVQVTAQAGVSQEQIESKLTQLRTQAQAQYELSTAQAQTFEREVAQQLTAKGYLTRGEIAALGERYNLTQAQQTALRREIGGARQIPGQYTPLSPLTSTFYQQTQLRPITPVTPAERRRVMRESLRREAPITGTIAVATQQVAQRAQALPTPRRPTVSEALRTAPAGFARGVTRAVSDTATGVATFAAAPVETTVQTGRQVGAFGKKLVTQPLTTTGAIGSATLQTIRRDPFFLPGYGAALGAESYAGGFAAVRGTRALGRVGQPLVGLTYRVGAQRVPAEEIFATPQLREIARGRVPGFPRLTPTETLERARQQRAVVTASPTLPGRTQVVQPGARGLAGLEDPGLFTTPLGFGSPRFLRVGAALPYPQVALTLSPFKAVKSITEEIKGAFTPARVAVVQDVEARRFPRAVVRERGFTGPRYRGFVESRRETGEVFVTKRSELGQTGETELIIPAGETIVRQPTRKFTTIEGYPGYTVPVFEFKLKTSRPLGRVGDVAEDITGLQRRRRATSVSRRRRDEFEVSPGRPVSRRSRGVSRGLSGLFSISNASAASRRVSRAPSSTSAFSRSLTLSGFSPSSAFSRGATPVSYTPTFSRVSAPVSRVTFTPSFTPTTTPPSRLRVSDEVRKISFKGARIKGVTQPKAYVPTLRATVGGIRAPRRGAKTKRLTGLEERPLLI